MNDPKPIASRTLTILINPKIEDLIIGTCILIEDGIFQIQSILINKFSNEMILIITGFVNGEHITQCVLESDLNRIYKILD